MIHRHSHRRQRRRPHAYIQPLAIILVASTLCLPCAPRILAGGAAEDSLAEARPPSSDAELRSWLENMVWHHRFTTSEIEQATGLNPDQIRDAIERFDLQSVPASVLEHDPTEPLRVLPYPGGRHPRIGFLDGAIRPQRDTKISIFTPWDPHSYVVVDLPEAIWSNLGLTYLAHTHIDTVWTKQDVTLPRREWTREPDGRLTSHRRLPNGIKFRAEVLPKTDGVRMKLWLTNGTDQPLSDLRVQNCVMLKGTLDFNQQTADNKVLHPPYAACRNASGDRWILTAWKPNHRPWQNPPVPCIHSDPKFPDCPPGETRQLQGWLSFYEGQDVEAEIQRLEATRWWKD